MAQGAGGLRGGLPMSGRKLLYYAASHFGRLAISACGCRNSQASRIDQGRIRDRQEKIGFMPTVRVKENEPFEVAMRRFKRTVEKTGLLTELRAREFYEKPTAERKRKRAAAIKRHFKRLRSQQLPPRMY